MALENILFCEMWLGRTVEQLNVNTVISQESVQSAKCGTGRTVRHENIEMRMMTFYWEVVWQVWTSLSGPSQSLLTGRRHHSGSRHRLRDWVKPRSQSSLRRNYLLILKYSQSSKLEQIDLCLHNVKTMKYFKENTKQRNVDKFFWRWFLTWQMPKTGV